MAIKNFYRLLGSLFCVTATILAAASAPLQQSDAPQIGDYSLGSARNVGTVIRPNGDIEVTIVGGGNVPVQLNSPNYDISAGRVVVLVKRIKVEGQPDRNKVTRMDATGNVKVVNRNPQNKQKTVITSNTATYSATTAVKDRGTVRLVGNVRSEVQGLPSAAAPLVSTGDTGTIKFLPDGSVSVDIFSASNNATFKGQFYEPTAKGKQP